MGGCRRRAAWARTHRVAHWCRQSFGPCRGGSRSTGPALGGWVVRRPSRRSDLASSEARPGTEKRTPPTRHIGGVQNHQRRLPHLVAGPVDLAWSAPPPRPPRTPLVRARASSKRGGARAGRPPLFARFTGVAGRAHTPDRTPRPDPSDGSSRGVVAGVVRALPGALPTPPSRPLADRPTGDPSTPPATIARRSPDGSRAGSGWASRGASGRLRARAARARLAVVAMLASRPPELRPGFAGPLRGPPPPPSAGPVSRGPIRARTRSRALVRP